MISFLHILTAAHCLYEASIKVAPKYGDAYVRVGSSSSFSRGENIFIQKMIIHDSYKYKQRYGSPNDIAVIKVSHWLQI